MSMQIKRKTKLLDIVVDRYDDIDLENGLDIDRKAIDEFMEWRKKDIAMMVFVRS